MILFNVYEYVGDRKEYICSFVCESDAHDFCLKHESQYNGRLGLEVVYDGN